MLYVVSLPPTRSNVVREPSVLCLECGVRSRVRAPDPGDSITCTGCEAELVVGVLNVERRRHGRRRRPTLPAARGLPARRTVRNVALLASIPVVVLVIVANPQEAESAYAWLQTQLAEQLRWWW